MDPPSQSGQCPKTDTCPRVVADKIPTAVRALFDHRATRPPTVTIIGIARQTHAQGVGKLAFGRVGAPTGMSTLVTAGCIDLIARSPRDLAMVNYNDQPERGTSIKVGRMDP